MAGRFQSRAKGGHLVETIARPYALHVVRNLQERVKIADCEVSSQLLDIASAILEELRHQSAQFLVDFHGDDIGHGGTSSPG
jgi:hypothetical protein